MVRLRKRASKSRASNGDGSFSSAEHSALKEAVLERCAEEFSSRFAHPEPLEFAAYVDTYARDAGVDVDALASLKLLRGGLLGCLRILDSWTPRESYLLRTAAGALPERSTAAKPGTAAEDSTALTAQPFGRYARNVFFLEEEIRGLAQWLVRLERSDSLSPPHALADEMHTAPPLTRRKVVCFLLAEDGPFQTRDGAAPTARDLAVASLLGGEEIPTPYGKQGRTVAAVIKRESITMRKVWNSVRALIPNELMWADRVRWPL